MVESIFTVVLEVVKCLAPPIERQLSNLRKYNSNLENLKNEIEKLKNDSESIQHKVDEAKGNGEDIKKNVQEWLAGVNNIITEADKFVGDEVTANKHCFRGLCPNLKTRHRLSKEAVRLQEAIVKLWEVGRFDRISYRTIPDDTWLMSKKDYYDFESRKTTLKKILGALKDPDVNMLGIYGMGGIGKTTLAKEVARQAENDKLFDQVVFTEVSHSQDIRKIQDEIADKLGLSFRGESESGRARSLCSRLKKEKRILVILDNIWENLDLLAVGIPHGDDHKGCKILLTARSEDVLSRKMDSIQNFSVGVLKEEEAWSLFKKMAGDYIEGSQFKPVATDVAKECAGLPVSIVTVARGLRNKRLFEWMDALQQLRRPSSMNFRHIQPKACSAIELSYSKLEGEELKKCFLLIGYTYITSINDLLMYGMGLGLIGGINKMEEARARVRTLVQKLKASCMLLDSKSDGRFSMHDVVRDVAILIASKQQNVFSVTGELANGWEWSSASTIKLCTSMVLYDVKTNVLPEVLECPKMKLFFIRAAKKSSSSTVPDNFFKRMKQVRVIDLTDMHLLSLPSSLGLLTNLQTLCLYYCNLQDITVIGDLKNLEILCFKGSKIEQLPVEISQLTRLRLLDLRNCNQLKVIPPNILSKLFHIEELFIGAFDKWEEEVKGMKNASVEELKHLPNLTSLELHIKDVNTLSRGLFFEKLKSYRIYIGEWEWDWDWEYRSKSSRTLRLNLNTNICWKDGLIVQLQGIEDLWLCGLQEQDIKYFVYELLRVGSSQLKHLKLYNPRESSKRPEETTSDMQSKEIIFEDALFLEKVALPNLEALFLHSINVERIWQSQLAAMSCGIQNLTKLIVHEFRNLICLFTSSIISSFVRLEYLMIRGCPVLEEIIVVDQAEMKNNIVTFPQLQFLKIENSEKLKGFSTGDVHVEFPSLKELTIRECPEFNHDLTKLVSVFPKLESLGVDAKRNPWILQLLEVFLCKLKHLDVILDESATILSLDDFFKRFHTIQILQMDGGNSIKFSNLNVENGMKATIRKVNKFAGVNHILKHSAILDNLEILQISKLEFENLITLMPSSTTFQNLTTLEVWFCDGMIKLLTSSTIKNLVQLRQIYIGKCNMLTEIVSKDDDQGDTAAKDEIVFNNLKELVLFHLQSLTSFYSGNCTFKFLSLERLVVENCPKMKIFSGGELSTPSLGKIHRYRNKNSDWTWEDDLNTTIRHLYLETMGVDKEENDKSTKENNAESSAQLGSGQKCQQVNNEEKVAEDSG